MTGANQDPLMYKQTLSRSKSASLGLGAAGVSAEKDELVGRCSGVVLEGFKGEALKQVGLSAASCSLRIQYGQLRGTP